MNTKKALLELFRDQGQCTVDGDKIVIDDTASVIMYVDLGSEVMTIRDIQGVRVADEVVRVTTKKETTFAVGAQHVRAVSFGMQSTKRTGII